MYSEHMKNKIWIGTGKIQAYIAEFVDDFLRSCILYSDEDSELIKMASSPRKEQLKYLSDLRKAASHYEPWKPKTAKTTVQKSTPKSPMPTMEKMFERLQKKFQGWPLSKGALRVTPEGFYMHELKKKSKKRGKRGE